MIDSYCGINERNRRMDASASPILESRRFCGKTVLYEPITALSKSMTVRVSFSTASRSSSLAFLLRFLSNLTVSKFFFTFLLWYKFLTSTHSNLKTFFESTFLASISCYSIDHTFVVFMTLVFHILLNGTTKEPLKNFLFLFFPI